MSTYFDRLNIGTSHKLHTGSGATEVIVYAEEGDGEYKPVAHFTGHTAKMYSLHFCALMNKEEGTES